MNSKKLKTSYGIIYSVFAVLAFVSCKKPSPDVYFNLNYCDTCLTIGGAIEYEKLHNSVQLTSMREEDVYLSVYRVFDPDYPIRGNRLNDGRIINAYKYFLEVDTIFKLKILKVYVYPYKKNEYPLLSRLFLEEIRIKIFNNDPVIDSLYNLPKFTECRYDSLKAVFNFLGKKYDKYFKEKYDVTEGVRKLADEVARSNKRYKYEEDFLQYFNGSDDIGIGIELYYNIPKEGRYEKYKNISPEDMSIYLTKTIHYKNYHHFEEAGYIMY